VSKTALVLSAGGYFAAYQAGAWKTLAKELQPDIVVGASAGALNGWPIAASCGPDELARMWLDPAAARNLTFRERPSLRDGLIEQGPLLDRVEQIFSGYRPTLAFGLIVVELPWLRPRLVTMRDITAQHLLATCSIPFVLPAVSIDGRRFTDGGLLEKLPIWGAIEMGANRIIAIDSFPKLKPWYVHAGCEFMRVFRPRRRIPREVRITVIHPSEPMGDARDAVVWKRQNAERWIDMGERDAAKVFRLQ
jgi:NTE family protein